MQEFIAIFVRHDHTGRMEHYEVFESTGTSSDDLTKMISTRIDELNRQFGIEQHDVFWEGYDSLRSLRRSHPELDIPDTAVVGLPRRADTKPGS